VKPKHLLQAASACRRALAPFVKDDWGAVQAGGLTWDVRQTVTHVCDAVGWYAAHLALRSPPRLRFELVDAYDTDATGAGRVGAAETPRRLKAPCPEGEPSQELVSSDWVGRLCRSTVARGRP
jgi:hypothetical protein